MNVWPQNLLFVEKYSFEEEQGTVVKVLKLTLWRKGSISKFLFLLEPIK